MRAVNEAWAVLSDPARRAAYDRSLGLAPDPDAFRPIEPDEPGDVDPRLQPDVPYRRVSAGEERRTRLATLIPISLFGFAVGAVVMGLAIGIPAITAFAVFAAISWVLVHGAGVAHRRTALILRAPLAALWDAVGNCGRPPQDDSTTIAAVGIVITAVAWFVVPLVVAFLFYFL